jgi:haloacid dehalogenase-like hydrolase
VRSEPKVMTSLDGLTSEVAKLVGVSDDLDAIATIGDMPNDVLMFAHSGLGIAMVGAGRVIDHGLRHERERSLGARRRAARSAPRQQIRDPDSFIFSRAPRSGGEVDVRAARNASRYR